MRLSVPKLNNWLCTMLVVSVMVLNSSNISNMVILGLLGFLFVLNANNLSKLFYPKFYLLVFMLIPLILAYFQGIDTVNLVRFVVLFMLIWIYPVPVNLTKRNTTVIGFAILYIILMQLSSAFGLGVQQFVSSYYPIENNLWATETLPGYQVLFTGLEARFGGVFYNPNIMGQIVCIVFILMIKDMNRYYQQPVFYLFGFLCFLSILIAGSRTAIVPFLIVGFFLFRKSIQKKYAIFYATILFIPVIFLLADFFQHYRVFDLTGGFDPDRGSIAVKYGILADYLHTVVVEQKDYFRLFFGNLTFDRQFDADIGYILSFLGLAPLILLLAFLGFTFLRTQHEYKYTYFVLLISVGATMLINYRFSILLFLLISFYANENKTIHYSMDRTSSS